MTRSRILPPTKEELRNACAGRVVLADTLADGLAAPGAIDCIAARLPRLTAEPLNVLTHGSCGTAAADGAWGVGWIGALRALIGLWIAAIALGTTQVATDARIRTARRSSDAAFLGRATRAAADLFVDTAAQARLRDAAGRRALAADIAAGVLRLAARCPAHTDVAALATDAATQVCRFAASLASKTDVTGITAHGATREPRIAVVPKIPRLAA
jgi:hypothetical protein